MSPTPPSVAFSLSAPLLQAARATRHHPAAALAPVLILLLPLVPLVAGIEIVLRGGGSAALQGLIAGAPDDRPGALILRPDLSGWLLLAALAALLLAMVAVVLAAGLVTGAAGARAAALGEERRHASVGAAVREALAVWPAMLVVLVAQLLLAGVFIGGLVFIAVMAGRLQFQLPTVVLTLGLGLLLVGAVRASLWPAIAIAENRAPLASLTRSWALTRKDVARLLGAALAAFLFVVVPAAIVQMVVKAILTALAGAEIIDLSPLAIDLWALLPLPVAVFLLSALWGREAPVLYAALDAFPADGEASA